jgi:serine/threonine protein kinase
MGGTHYSARKFDKKVVTEQENPLAMVRLMNEIEILRVLRTEKVLQLNEVYETEDSIYLVTDFVHNMTLKKMLKAAASSLFSEAKTRTIIQQILKVLAHMASKKIVHRNLKPSNFMMENNQKIRLTNFSLATYVNAPKANVGICGTPGYIAPEILHSSGNRVYDDKADVFSAGCIFFEMLLGYPLFKGSKTSEISSSNKHFKYSDLIQLVTKELNNAKLNSTKFGKDEKLSF